MSDLDFLGADTVQATVPVPGGWASLDTAANAKKAKDLQQQKDDAKNAQFKRAVTTYLVGGLVGSVLGGVAGALLWRTHRVAGGLVGGLLVGPAVGYGVGMAVAVNEKK